MQTDNMNTNNKIHTFGDNNIQLQNITARDINIITGQETNTEIKNEKTEIANQLADLLKSLDTINKEENLQSENLSEDDFDDVAWDDLIEAIEIGKCILFVGQDISVDEEGNSLHEKFFKSISRRKIEYNNNDGFFMPGSDRQIETKALSYYAKKFQKENTLANKLLPKLAQIPFSLIVSVSPDDTMHRIFEKYNKKHEFVFYEPDNKQETAEPTIENPIIFNLLGNAAADGKYIYTHEQFYKYVNENQEVKIPIEIESKITDVSNYIFIGIDFNRWYNRLLLFTLNLYEDSEAYSFTAKQIEDFTQNFINKQFNILNIENNYTDFVNLLGHKCKEANVYQPLVDTFIDNTIKEITAIKDKARKSDSLVELSEIKNQISNIYQKTNKLQ